MMTKAVTELTLDPQDWDAVRASAHQALDAVLDYQQQIRTKPAWQNPPETTKAFLDQAAPQLETDSTQVVEEMMQHIIAYPSGTAHPRFWGWVCGTGTPIGMIADMLASGVNATSGTFNDAFNHVHDQVIAWMRDLFELPQTATGLVTSGASVANVIGMAVGRDAILGAQTAEDGLHSLQAEPVIYASTQVHSSVDKAMRLIGLGAKNLRKVAIDEAYRMDLTALEAAIEADLAAGRKPIAIVASAGTVNTGSIDALDQIADIAERYQLWFHVDGAIGGIAMMSPNLKPKFKGIERADSIAFDFHKWLYVPYQAGCVLVRDGQKHRKSFTVSASYLTAPTRGVGAVTDGTNGRGPELSRAAKALKVWAQIKTYGYQKLGMQQEQNVAQVQYFETLVDAEPRLEKLAPVALNILCFRYLPENLPEHEWDNFNLELLMRIQEQGIAVPSHTIIDGKFALRVANTNHRSRNEDFELLRNEVLRIAKEMEHSK